MSDWISVEDRTPTEPGDYLVVAHGLRVVLVRVRDWAEDTEGLAPTSWMPCPPIPAHVVGRGATWTEEEMAEYLAIAEEKP